MPGQILSLKDALNILDTGNWCTDISFVSYDAKRGKAGEIVRIKRARLAAQPAGAQVKEKVAALLTGDIRKVKTTNGEIRSFHPRLLFAINGRAVI